MVLIVLKTNKLKPAYPKAAELSFFSTLTWQRNVAENIAGFRPANGSGSWEL